MDSRPVPSISVLLSGVLCIIFGALAILAALLVALGGGAGQSAQPEVFTPHVLIAVRIVMLTFLLAGAVGVLVGMGIMGLKNWARKAMVLISGATVVLSVICLYASLALLATPLSPHLTPRAAHILWDSFLGITVFSLGIGLWWVVLFTRPSVVASFTGAALTSAASFEPSCPLPLALFAGYYIAVVIFIVSSLAIPQSVPDMLFGRAIFGPAYNLYSLTISGLCLAAAIGLFKLKTWSFKLALGIEVFSVVRRVVSILDPRSAETIHNALRVMAAQGYKAPGNDPTLHFRYFEILGLGFSLAMLAILLLSRSSFMEAASVAQSPH